MANGNKRITVLCSLSDIKNIWKKIFAESAYHGIEIVYYHNLDSIEKISASILIWDVDAFKWPISFIDHLAKNISIFIISDKKERAFLCSEYGLSGFWLKPINGDIINRDLAKILKSNHNSLHDLGLYINHHLPFRFEKRLRVSTYLGYEFLICKNIIRIQAERAYCKIYTWSRNEYLITKSLSELEKELPKHLFYRTHISHLINVCYVSRIHKRDRGDIELSDGSMIPLAIRRKEDFLLHLETLSRKA